MITTTEFIEALRSDPDEWQLDTCCGCGSDDVVRRFFVVLTVYKPGLIVPAAYCAAERCQDVNPGIEITEWFK